ncbi:MAG: hypothetical protein QOF89_969 [Acidobacteriota bacterium]|jgi:hypothetical protein|nr:hypothetical protein [Acidobacteriota bacterium]
MALWKSCERCCAALLLCGVLGSPAGRAQEPPPLAAEEQDAESLKPKLTFGLEAKANFRHSDDNRFPVPFPFLPSQLPPGQTQGFEETVNPGDHLEVSDAILYMDASWGDGLAAHGKVSFIDLYTRNPTSTGKSVDVHEAWIRFGVETPPATLAPRGGVYLKVGKLPKFERQNDRHLESYGLVSTAFNRLEDVGAELGLNLGRHLYVKAAATAGNPVFLRDPNALAGDNGTPELLRPNPDPTLYSGIVILYDAKVEDLDTDGKLAASAGLGWRTADEAGRNGFDVLVFGHQRKLAKTVPRDGSFYGGDLDLLNGPGDGRILPIKGDDKKEVGGNLWVYFGGFSFFAQYVDQKLAGLPRTGLEGEVAWRFDLPLVWAIGGRQLFTYVAPAVRYSKLDNGFRNIPPTPAPSFAWDWQKIDAGVRLGIFPGVDLTAEYAINHFILGSGATRENNEGLATLRWRIQG